MEPSTSTICLVVSEEESYNLATYPNFATHALVIGICIYLYQKLFSDL